MDGMWAEFAKYGFGGLMCGLMLYMMFKDNTRLKDDAARDTQWKIDTITKQTEAAFTLAQAMTKFTDTMAAMNNTIAELKARVER